jgi:hypothetical protein
MTSTRTWEDRRAVAGLDGAMDARLVVGGVLIVGALAAVPVATLVTGDNPTTT